ncbi:hypothetical protein Nepgr_033547 [Nepenthes gracilis]|uniref:Uncharacterized protein n=1 Tax=Nepenthes gracilis TaxID=150966 RepID=A0AAD3TMI5_NEPGR|nr:hypothetical protein Nepgr_033547 [Nepenthes gracilis]
MAHHPSHRDRQKRSAAECFIRSPPRPTGLHLLSINPTTSIRALLLQRTNFGVARTGASNSKIIGKCSRTCMSKDTSLRRITAPRIRGKRRSIWPTDARAQVPKTLSLVRSFTPGFGLGYMLALVLKEVLLLYGLMLMLSYQYLEAVVNCTQCCCINVDVLYSELADAEDLIAARVWLLVLWANCVGVWVADGWRVAVPIWVAVGAATDAEMVQTPGLYWKAADVGFLAFSYSPPVRFAWI